MRHGQSMWNAANLFTGWVDVPLTQVGIDEALAGGKKLADVQIDEVHTSTLIRAQMTAMLALSQHNGISKALWPASGLQKSYTDQSRW